MGITSCHSSKSMHSLSGLQHKFGQALVGSLKMGEPRELYEPIEYILGIGGKRLRPVAVLMACDLFQGDVDKALYPALAVEVFHNFTLMHDDIMDKAPLRRGKVTVHEHWDTNTAILSGDAMMIQSYRFLEHLSPELLAKALPLFNRTALEVCEGQQLDMNFERLDHVSIDQYLHMIAYKTAVLLACALKLGAWVANASEEDAEHLYQFGKHIGIAFQIQDDILDVFADQNKFGKQVGGDILCNKKTFLLLKAMEQSTGEVKAKLMDYLQGEHADEDKVQGVTAIYESLGIREMAEAEMEKHYHAALEHLDAIAVEPERKQELQSLASFVTAREV